MNDIARAYQQTASGGAEFSNPHKLIAMLLEGAHDRLTRALGHIEREEVAAKGENLSRAAAIFEHLRGSLQHGLDDGGLAENLDSLYDYMSRRITEANLYNDPDRIHEVVGLLGEIRAGWNAIPEGDRAPAPQQPGTDGLG